MIDGIIQVNDDNIDDILDTTYEIMLMFCNGVKVFSFVFTHSIRTCATSIVSRICVLLSFWRSWRSLCI